MPPSWEEAVPGRAGVLRLRGPEGGLDLWALYFATGVRAYVRPRGAAPPEQEAAGLRTQRARMREVVSAAVSRREEVLSVLAGDFNWVTKAEDRWNKAAGTHTGGPDAGEGEVKLISEKRSNFSSRLR